MKNNKSSSEGWGMGFLLVFFPEENHPQEEITNKKPLNFNLFSNSSSILPLSVLKRTNSTHLLQKAQSTISICLLLLFTTLLLFTLSTIPTTTPTSTTPRPRRHLNDVVSSSNYSASHSHALQGMGNLYRRGTRAMNDLIVAHAVESLSLHEFKLFLRLIHRSGVTSRSDLLIVFPTKTRVFENAIIQENDSFLKLVTHYIENLGNHSERLSFDVTQFVKMSKKEKASGETIWGRKIRANFSEEGEAGSTRLGYGSVMGFDVDELDPENSLSGFMDSVPMNLRRWACYPMLLGRVRRNFKHVMLVDMKEILVLGDQLGRVRTQSPESVILHQSGSRHGKRNSDKTQSTRIRPVNPGIITGGLRGVRRLSNAMLTDIVRATMQHNNKRRNPVSESGLLNQLVGNEFVSKNVNLIVSTESVPELKSGTRLSNQTVIRRGGNSNFDVNSVVMKHICSFPLDSKVYSEC